MNRSYLSIASDGTPQGTLVSVINPETGEEIEVQGIYELTLELGAKQMASANIVVHPQAVTAEVKGRDVSWAFDCPVCSEHVDHECRPPDWVALVSAVPAEPRRGLPPEPGVPVSAARPAPRPALKKKDD